MKTRATEHSSSTGSGLFAGFSVWKALVLAAILPLAAACTDTVTGVDRATDDTQARIDDSSGTTSDDVPVAQ